MSRLLIVSTLKPVYPDWTTSKAGWRQLKLQRALTSNYNDAVDDDSEMDNLDDRYGVTAQRDQTRARNKVPNEGCSPTEKFNRW